MEKHINIVDVRKPSNEEEMETHYKFDDSEDTVVSKHSCIELIDGEGESRTLCEAAYAEYFIQAVAAAADLKVTVS